MYEFLPASVSVYRMNVCCFQQPIEAIRFPGAGVASCFVGPENQTQDPWKSNKCSQLLHNLSSIVSLILKPELQKADRVV